MKTVQVLIVDDEPLAREVIKTHLQKISNWNVVKTCINAEEAYEALLNNTIDVLFLDIQMPVITGVEFLQSLQNPPLVIFTTAYSKYALKGFELNAIDYLLKPISFGRFSQAIDKANKKLTTISGDPKTENASNYFFVKQDGKLIKIKFSEIVYIKAEQEYSFIFTKKEKLLVSMHLKMLEKIIPKNQFTRIHRSYIVPQESISTIYGNTIQIGENIQLPIGSTYKENLLQKLNIKK
ncbi:LytTR family two component transcriptional regulator [Lutibacter sp. Hel_I_33_5]|uniref:LytR/AlgR family response regulator transcription factor n=1 Tax=Lutibacter sp. Hel_I_33_5 TaxID=1566289 RepID=UPI0011A68955|nr:response regulator [Lutibacter sp. Hel_I_33_5]TVZ55010.1 LytTR family two component transcriptional regulator [Lutibacter sp. Hel_I_33_5]